MKNTFKKFIKSRRWGLVVLMLLVITMVTR